MSDYDLIRPDSNVVEATAGAVAREGDWHYIHPVDPSKTWCGSSRHSGAIRDPEPRTVAVPCIVCLDLRATYGVSGWLALRDGAA